MEKIYLRNFKRGKGITILDLIEKIIISDYRYKMNDTFYDKEYINKQCKSGANRTPDDIYIIVKTYFPNASEKTVFNKMYEFISNNTHRVFLYRCSTINKFVFFNGNIVGFKRINNIFIETGHLGVTIPDNNNRTINSLMMLFTN